MDQPKRGWLDGVSYDSFISSCTRVFLSSDSPPVPSLSSILEEESGKASRMTAKSATRDQDVTGIMMGDGVKGMGNVKVKTMQGGVIPTIATELSAGMDLYVPDDITCVAGEVTTIPLGIQMCLPQGSWGVIMSRSSLFRKGLSVGGGRH